MGGDKLDQFASYGDNEATIDEAVAPAAGASEEVALEPEQKAEES